MEARTRAIDIVTASWRCQISRQQQHSYLERGGLWLCVANPWRSLDDERQYRPNRRCTRQCAAFCPLKPVRETAALARGRSATKKLSPMFLFPWTAEIAALVLPYNARSNRLHRHGSAPRGAVGSSTDCSPRNRAAGADDPQSSPIAKDRPHKFCFCSGSQRAHPSSGLRSLGSVRCGSPGTLPSA